MSAPIRSRTFKSGNSEAVRLPRGMGFGVGRDVVMERRGDQLIIRPVENAADARRRLRRLVADLKAIGRV
ncbi:antitoxin, partial [Sphingosinicella sp.]|uniref:antitoxin n=1 Tax=Sphingosinicella sp. TaxID=1917971 RepID=UPI0040379CBB